MGFKEICEAGTSNAGGTGFSMPLTGTGLGADPEITCISDALKTLEGELDSAVSQHVIRGVFRNAFFIELVNEAVTTTRYRVRWTTELHGDPRHAEADVCREVLVRVAGMMAELASSREGKDILEALAAKPMVPYEIPVDWLDPTAAKIHMPGNLTVVASEISGPTARLRTRLLSGADGFERVFRSLYGKLRVKSYQTDRALTGVAKTNREKRWETHPQSVQFSSRADCMSVELRLVRQLLSFEGFPSTLGAELIDEGLLDPQVQTSRCPVTLDPFSFQAVIDEVDDPIHGKSDLQVGHLDPLKSTPAETGQSGHRGENVSWISQDGNRIQGHLTLDETRAMLLRISENYSNAE